MDARGASETFVTICKITRRHIPEARDVNSHYQASIYSVRALDLYLGGASSNLSRDTSYP
jgi:hypothetical protein